MCLVIDTVEIDVGHLSLYELEPNDPFGVGIRSWKIALQEYIALYCLFLWGIIDHQKIVVSLSALDTKTPQMLGSSTQSLVVVRSTDTASYTEEASQL